MYNSYLNHLERVTGIPNSFTFQYTIEINKERFQELRGEGYSDFQIIQNLKSSIKKSVDWIKVDKETHGLLNSHLEFDMDIIKPQELVNANTQ